MEHFWAEWAFLTGVILLAVMSPGPDLVVAIRNAMMYSRKAGLWTAIGFGLGVSVHVTYCIIGIAALIAQSVLLFSIIKYAGAAYLFYVGFQALRSKGFDKSALKTGTTGMARSMTSFQAIRSGFITNLLNPKATLFFLAVFTQIVEPATPLNVQIIYGLTAIAIVVIWFSLVAIVLTNSAIKNRFLGLSKWFDRACGGALIALGIRLALTAPR